jgi:hypothetical protein
MDPSLYDLNGDGHVTPDDLFIFRRAFGRQAGDPLYNEACDFDGDGRVDLADYNTLYSAYLAEWAGAMNAPLLTEAPGE